MKSNKKKYKLYSTKEFESLLFQVSSVFLFFPFFISIYCPLGCLYVCLIKAIATVMIYLSFYLSIYQFIYPRILALFMIYGLKLQPHLPFCLYHSLPPFPYLSPNTRDAQPSLPPLHTHLKPHTCKTSLFSALTSGLSNKKSLSLPDQEQTPHLEFLLWLL